jgi:hypothetical protein
MDELRCERRTGVLLAPVRRWDLQKGETMKDTSGLILDVTPFDEPIDRNLLEQMGHPVQVCHGPAWGHVCPIVTGNCSMVDSAHGIVFRLDLDRPVHRVILRRYQEAVTDDIPIAVVVTPGQEEQYADILTGVQVWVGEPTIAELDGFAAQTEAADELR